MPHECNWTKEKQEALLVWLNYIREIGRRVIELEEKVKMLEKRRGIRTAKTPPLKPPTKRSCGFIW